MSPANLFWFPSTKTNFLATQAESATTALSPSKSGQFLAARQALFNGDNAAAGFYFDRALPEGTSSLMLENRVSQPLSKWEPEKAAAIAVELEQLGSGDESCFQNPL